MLQVDWKGATTELLWCCGTGIYTIQPRGSDEQREHASDMNRACPCQEELLPHNDLPLEST